VTLTAADVASGTTRAITVATPVPGGGASDPATLTIVGPSLVVDVAIAPLNGPVAATFANGPGRAGEWIGVYPANGGGYVDWQWISGGQSGPQPRANGTLVFPTGGRALAAGSYVLRWISGGQIAKSAVFTLAEVPAAPALASLDPVSVVAGSGATTFRARGTAFTAASVLRVNGVDRATTFVSSTELMAALSAPRP
jgi:hypothetical protein